MNTQHIYSAFGPCLKVLHYNITLNAVHDQNIQWNNAQFLPGTGTL